MSPLNTFTISNQQEFLNNPLLEKALTSHLQTSGCSVVIGVKCQEINLVSRIEPKETIYYCQLLILPMQYMPLGQWFPTYAPRVLPPPLLPP